jgi:hypothetical protein
MLFFQRKQNNYKRNALQLDVLNDENHHRNVLQSGEVTDDADDEVLFYNKNSLQQHGKEIYV